MGPIEQATILCAEHHRFTVLVDRHVIPRPSEQDPGRWGPTPRSN
jgi:microcompartment protein CcmL/EutN